ncbi:MAG: hypothetical protein ABEI77_09840 [Halorientalis sp.]
MLGAALVPILDPAAPLLVVAYAAALGVLVDLDHFLLARVNTGRWRATTNVIRNPQLLVFDQESIFETGEVGAVQRLESHVVITVVLVVGWLPIAPSLAIVSGVVLVGHIVSDVIWDFTTLLGPAHALVRDEKSG